MEAITRALPGSGSDGDEALPDLAELCRLHDVGLDLIQRSENLDDLLDRVLEEYERRLADLPAEALDPGRGALPPEGAKKLRALMMFASQAVALKARAEAAVELKRRAGALAEANERLRAALAEADTSRARLDGVLAALEAGILLVSADGTVLNANPAAAALTATSSDGLAGRPVPDLLRDVPAGGDLELRIDAGETGSKVLLASRRPVAVPGGDEVFLLSDVTRRYGEIEERHRLEKLGEVLRTLSVLSHKINNPLTALVGRSQLLKARAGADPAVVKAATVIEESAMRIAELIRELAGVVKEGRKEALDRVLETSGPGMPTPGGGAT